MRKKDNINRSRRSAGKVITGVLLGSVVGATVGWLTAPTSGEELRRRIKGEVKGVQAKARTAAGNIESRARELAEEAKDNIEEVKDTVTRRRKAVSSTTQSYE